MGSTWRCLGCCNLCFSWRHKDDSVQDIIWAGQGCKFFIPVAKRLVGLPAVGIGETVIEQPWNGPELPSRTHISWFGFSPCGQLLIGAWQMPRPDATTGGSEWRSDIAQPHHLWRGSSAMESLACTMISVATSTMPWFVREAAWHPVPSCSHIYAICSGDGRISLVDGNRHAILRSWAQQDVLQGPVSNSIAAGTKGLLEWSLDGS